MRLLTIGHAREFLPLPCFGDCDLVTLSKKFGQLSYEDFSAPKSSDDMSEGIGRRGQPMKTILRNREENADRLLDLLVGAFITPGGQDLVGG